MKARPRKSEEAVTDAVVSYFWWGGTIYNEWAARLTEEEILTYWKTHYDEILERYIERNRQRKGEPGARPRMFWDELEEQGHKRRRTGTHVWCGPVRGDGGDREIREPRFESDLRFLKRLGLPLAPWETK